MFIQCVPPVQTPPALESRGGEDEGANKPDDGDKSDQQPEAAAGLLKTEAVKRERSEAEEADVKRVKVER
jgi:hypothetical protein